MNANDDMAIPFARFKKVPNVFKIKDREDKEDQPEPKAKPRPRRRPAKKRKTNRKRK